MRYLVAIAVSISLMVGCLAMAGASEEIVIYGTYQEVPSVGTWPASATGQIGVDGVAFFVIPDNGGGLTLAQRCAIVDTRITEILSHGVLVPVTVKPIRGKATSYVGPYRLITIYPCDARNVGVACSQQLAMEWAKSTAEGLAKTMPSCFLGPAAGQ